MGRLLMASPFDWDISTIDGSDNPVNTPLTNLTKTDPTLLWSSGSNPNPYISFDAGIDRQVNLIAPLFSRCSKYASWQVRVGSDPTFVANAHDSEGTWGRAISLDNGVMRTNYNGYSFQSFTVAFRILLRSTRDGLIMSKTGTAPYSMNLNIVNLTGGPKLRWGVPSHPYAELPIEIVPGVWHHCAVSYDSITRQLQLFWDTRLMAVNTHTDNVAQDSGYDLVFGNATTGADFVVQQVSLWDYPKNAAQVAEIASQPLQYPWTYSNLVSYWPMGEDTGATVAASAEVGAGSDPRPMSLSSTYHWVYGMPVWASAGLENYDRVHGMYYFPNIADINGQRYVRLDFRDPGKSNVELGRVVIAKAYQPSRNYKYNAAYGHRDQSDVFRAPSGSVSIRRGANVPFAKYAIQFTNERELRANVMEMQRRVGGSREVLVILDPDDDGFRIQRMYYGLMASVSQNVHQNFSLFEAGFEVEGLV